MQRIKLDPIDRRILAELQTDGRITNVDLSRKAQISAPPCLRRVRALEDAGYIKGYHAELDAKLLGYGVSGFAMVGLRSQADADLRAFEAKVNAWPIVRECTMLSGEVDFILKCVARDLEAWNGFISELTATPNVASVKTSLAVRSVKREPGVPVPLDQGHGWERFRPMIPRRQAGGWRTRALFGLVAVVLLGGVAAWFRTPVPSAGLPDSDIRPFLAPATTHTFSSARRKATGSIYESIVPNKPSAQPVHAIIVYVHGISCHSPDYSAPFQFRLAKALGMTREAEKAKAPTVDIIELTPTGKISKAVPDYLTTDDFAPWSATATPSEVKAQFQAMRRQKSPPPEFAVACSNAETGEMVVPLDHPRLSVRTFSNKQGDRLSVVEVLWSPVSERQKLLKVGEDLNLDASRLRSAPLWPVERQAPHAEVEKRALANQVLKASVINGAIADAIFYLGDGGPAIKSAVMAGIVQAMHMRKATNTAETHRVSMMMVTESLGSRIVFDTIREAPDKFADDLDQAVGLITSHPRVVMFANQLPLLDIAQNPDRTLANSRTFSMDIRRHTARARALVEAGNREAGRNDFKFHGPDDPPSWRACAEAFDYYLSTAKAVSPTNLGSRIGGRSGAEFADAWQTVLTRPLVPLSELFSGPGAPKTPAEVLETLKTSTRIAGHAMAFLAFSPGGLGYANCQKKLSLERARVEAFYASPDATPVDRDGITQSERLLKIAEDFGRTKILDIDAISNSRASLVFGILFMELSYLTDLCAKPQPSAAACTAEAIKARMRRIAAMVPRIEVLAFSDPNDLLSYRVTAEQYGSETFAFSNVPVRLAAPIVPAAGAWGGFTPPMEAHTNHKFDNRILAMLVCGWDKAAKRTYTTVNGKPCPLQLSLDNP